MPLRIVDGWTEPPASVQESSEAQHRSDAPFVYDLHGNLLPVGHSIPEYGCFDASGRDADGYGVDGFNVWGYDQDGRDDDGLDEDGWDREGYDVYGYDREGFDSDGYNSDGDSREDLLADDDEYGEGERADSDSESVVETMFVRPSVRPPRYCSIEQEVLGTDRHSVSRYLRAQGITAPIGSYSTGGGIAETVCA